MAIFHTAAQNPRDDLTSWIPSLSSHEMYSQPGLDHSPALIHQPRLEDWATLCSSGISPWNSRAVGQWRACLEVRAWWRTGESATEEKRWPHVTFLLAMGEETRITFFGFQWITIVHKEDTVITERSVISFPRSTLITDSILEKAYVLKWIS